MYFKEWNNFKIGFEKNDSIFGKIVTCLMLGL